MGDETTAIKKLAPNEALVSWEAPDFVHHERDIKWYLVASLVFLGFMAYSIYTRDWFFIVILVLVTAGTGAYLKSSPKIKHYTISRLGVEIDGVLHAYDSLHSFWIIYQDKVKTLNFMQTKKLAPAITIQLDGEDPTTIKNILKRFLPEEEKRGENYADVITRILRF